MTEAKTVTVELDEPTVRALDRAIGLIQDHNPDAVGRFGRAEGVATAVSHWLAALELAAAFVGTREAAAAPSVLTFEPPPTGWGQSIAKSIDSYLSEAPTPTTRDTMPAPPEPSTEPG